MRAVESRKTNDGGGSAVLLLALGGALLAAALACDLAFFEAHVYRAYCAENVEQLRRPTVVRAILFAASAVTLTFGIRALRRQRFRLSLAPGSVGTGARLAVAILLAAVLTEAVLRRKNPYLILAPFPRRVRDYPSGFVPPIEPTAWGWKNKPNTTTRGYVGRPEYEVLYHVDAFGNRVASPDAAVDPKAPVLVFAGESAVFGLGLPWEETFPALVGKALGLPVVNLGVSGYGNGHAYQRLLEELPRFERPAAIVMSAVLEQIERDAFDHRVRLALVDGRIAMVPPEREFLRTSPLRELFRRVFPSSGSAPVELAHALFANVQATGRARGAEVLFVFSSCFYNCALPEGVRRPTIEGRLLGDLPHVSVPLGPDDRIRGDSHPGPRGARKMADAVVAALAARTTR